MNDLTKSLKDLLSNEELTCVITDGMGLFYKSTDRGIKPLYDFIVKNYNSGPYYLADKIIGKAAALLCVKAGIKEVYSHVISTPAIEVFKENSISCFFDQEVPHILNRTNTGLCPMEGLSAGVETPDEMFEKIETWITSMKSS